ncbi:MAG: DMT family transporter [Ruminococcus sp.]|nr:DMT family transporter [Ruminococcus sp.]
MNKNIMTKSWVVILIAFICSALWGTAFSGVKIGYDKFGIEAADWSSQMIFAGTRFAIAGIMTILAGSLAAKKLLLPTKSSIPKIAMISLFQTVLQYFFYYIGLAHTTGVKAAVIVAAKVFAAILISSLIYRLEKLTMRKIIGCILGFSGIIIINMNGLKSGLNFSLLGDGFILISTIANGFSSVLIKKYSSNENPVLLSGWQFLFGGLIMAIIGLACGGNIGNITVNSVTILLYLAFVSAAAYSLWAMLLKYNPVSKVSVFGFMNPVCGVVISSIVLKESGSIGIHALAALALVCLGIFIVNREKNKSIS